MASSRENLPWRGSSGALGGSGAILGCWAEPAARLGAWPSPFVAPLGVVVALLDVVVGGGPVRLGLRRAGLATGERAKRGKGGKREGEGGDGGRGAHGADVCGVPARRSSGSSRAQLVPLVLMRAGMRLPSRLHVGLALASAALPVSCGGCERRVEEPLPEVRPLTALAAEPSALPTTNQKPWGERCVLQASTPPRTPRPTTPPSPDPGCPTDPESKRAPRSAPARSPSPTPAPPLISVEIAQNARPTTASAGSCTGRRCPPTGG